MQHKTKSRTFRRVKVRVVSGTKTSYQRKKPSAPTCPETGQKLKGVPRALPFELKKMPKSSKRPERPYGGVLSSEATRKLMKNKARNLEL
ncbi:50S ribosomal protein L34e [Candidatus Woesearchaeota archaeon]|nr:50S ribosomal protein L34e [Candidatus Woesearchaeota archaeon]